MKSFHDGKVILHAGDCMEVLRTMPADSIDAVCTDPPYHLTSIVKRFGAEDAAPCKVGKTGAYARASRGFMGKQWDGGDIAFQPELWTEVLRVLKPGGHMVCFGGTRTYHRMVCAIEDAGFEIRDAIMWHYGSGFPKSHDVSKGIDRAAGVTRTEVSGSKLGRPGMSKDGSNQRSGFDHAFGGEMSAIMPSDIMAPATDAARQWQGYGTALKPATEIICLARKPLSESTVAANVLRWGTGALNIDATRIQTTNDLGRVNNESASWGTYGSGPNAAAQGLVSGRWPANLCHDGSPEVMAGFPDTASGAMKREVGPYNGENVTGFLRGNSGPNNQHGDSGSAARFFASFPQEENQCQFPIGHAKCAESSFTLSSEVAASVLMCAVGATTERLEARWQSYQAHDTSVSGNQLDEISTLLTAAILHLEKRFLRGLPLERHSLSSSLASIAAIPRATGIIAITISLSKSNGYAEAATFDCIETNLEAGAPASAKRFHYGSKADSDDRLKSAHPTIKPVALMVWLAKLITPPNGVILDPFSGTGTTGEAAFREGFRSVLIEREAEYLADIERRMGMLLSGADERARKLATPDPHDTLPLFAVMP